jgi:thiol:disulfide interchange protein DsbC
MMRQIKLLSLLLTLAAMPAQAAETGAETAAKVPMAKADPQKVIAAKLPGIDASSIKEAPIPGMYEVSVGTNVAYVSSDARYLIRGDLIDLDSDINLTEQRRNNARMQQLSAMSEDNMIIFGPEAKDAKYEITVFTDIDCGYCRKLHAEIAQLNDLGVRVRYVFYPRSGPNSASWQKAEDVWCAADRKSAFTAAKQGQTVESADCGTTPVTEEWQMGQAFGVRGTPAIITSDGKMIAGYLPPPQLVARLDSEKRLTDAAKSVTNSLR